MVDLLGEGLGLGFVVLVGVGDGLGLGLVLLVPLLDGDGDGLGELLDGDGELDSVALGLAVSLGDGLVLELEEELAVAERLGDCESGWLAAVSSVAPTVRVAAVVLLVAAEAFLEE